MVNQVEMDPRDLPHNHLVQRKLLLQNFARIRLLLVYEQYSEVPSFRMPPSLLFLTYPLLLIVFEGKLHRKYRNKYEVSGYLNPQVLILLVSLPMKPLCPALTQRRRPEEHTVLIFH